MQIFKSASMAMDLLITYWPI